MRTGADAAIQTIDFLDEGSYGDMPHHVTLGRTATTTLLCGRLKVRWPGGLDPRSLPHHIKLTQDENLVRLDVLIGKLRGVGASAVLTRAAALLLTSGLRDHPQCRSIFSDSNHRDPVSRAIQYIELHPHQDWTVARLAAKVGMARSTFAARFIRETGRPPMGKLTEARMELAAELLRTSDMKISEIADRVSYRSQSAFSRRFERHFNVTPGRMRADRHATEG